MSRKPTLQRVIEAFITDYGGSLRLRLLAFIDLFIEDSGTDA